MFRFSQIAAPAVLGTGLLVGVAGCRNDRDTIPADATMISSGSEEVTAVAPNDGTVYVFDDTSNRTVYVGRVRKGDSVRVDAKDDKVMFDGKTAVERELWDDHRYQVFFDRDERTARRDDDDTTVVRQRQDGSTVIQRGDDKTVIEPKEDKTIIRKEETVIEKR